MGRLNRVRRNPRVKRPYNTSLVTQNTKGQPGTVHTYANGQKVFVRPRRTVGAVKPLQGGINQPAVPKPFDSAPSLPPAPPPPVPAVPAPVPVPQGPESLMDAEYLAWRAQAEFDKQQQLAGFDADDRGDETSRSEAIRRLMQRRPEDLQQANVSHNKAGLFYSGMLGKERDSIEGSYVRQQADTNADYDSRRAARAAARQALEQGYTLEEAAQLAAAADRKSGRDLEAADARALVREPADAVEAGPTPAAGTAVPSRSAAAARASKRPVHVPHTQRALATRRARKKRPH